ncbi:MAG: M42 family metallopeptidase [Fretibacterium sp.]|nr:M42 family metallopeptidase [Fretibacterium sp.]
MDVLTDRVIQLTLELLAVPSVSGDCERVLKRVESELASCGLPCTRTHKGAVIAVWEGQDNQRQRVVTAHVDTLGAVVRYIRKNGRLRLYPIGGFDWRSFEGENCTVHTLDGQEYRGTLLPDKAARHAFPPEAHNEAHTLDNVEVRLDVLTDSRESTEALGIHPGDIVSFDPRSEVTDTGFIKSRFLDDKLGAALVLTAVKVLKEKGTALPNTTHFYFSNYEEIGHGTPAIPPAAAEIAAIDIGVVSEGCSSSEHAATILSRDGIMPYDRDGVRRLKALAEAENIPYRIDAYQNYGSDASTCVRSGKDIRALCFGPAAEATHNYERTHRDSVKASLQLLEAYLLSGTGVSQPR